MSRLIKSELLLLWGYIIFIASLMMDSLDFVLLAASLWVVTGAMVLYSIRALYLSRSKVRSPMMVRVLVSGYLIAAVVVVVKIHNSMDELTGSVERILAY